MTDTSLASLDELIDELTRRAKARSDMGLVLIISQSVEGDLRSHATRNVFVGGVERCYGMTVAFKHSLKDILLNPDEEYVEDDNEDAE
jgi:hypothetical protein